MKLMPSTTLHDLDYTDVDSLLPWYLWKTGAEKDKEGIVVWRKGKPYRRVNAKEAAWLEKAF